MRHRSRQGIAGALALVLLAGGVGRADPITQVVVFGDSLSDTGNVSAATGGAVPPAPYAGGRFSNGPNWVEQFATRLGVPAPTPSLQGGTDYAFGYAQTGTGTTATPVPGFSVPNLSTQVGAFLAGNTPKAGQLFVLWAGANDFFNGQANPAVPAANVAAAAQTLIQAGGRNFLALNLPALGNTPFGATLPPAQQQGINAVIAAFNSDLAGDLGQLQASNPGVALHTLDTAGLLQQIEAGPAAYGLTNVTDAALFTGHAGDPGYLFWDSVHPTTQGHALIAAAAIQAVPEPATLTLMGLGLAGAALGARRRRTPRAA
jgi:phospholipase/lecithinase/hemolysin